ncbi:hypothetical+protein [Methylocapsa aurea]|jgi:hypothetical protein
MLNFAPSAQAGGPTDRDIDVAIQVCSVGKRIDASVEIGLEALKRRLVSGKGAISVSEIPSIIGESVQSDGAKKELFLEIQRCVERHVYDRPPPIDGQPPRSDRIDRPRSVGWLATIGGSEHGGGRFGSFGERTVLLPTTAAIDVRRNLPRELSQRNVFVQLTATTDHQVDNPGAWIYFVKLIGAAQSYTQCMNFEVSSDGAPIGGGAVPILSGASTTFDTSASASQSRGRHKIGIRLGCYFQGGQFPVVTVQLKTPFGDWRAPTEGDFTVAEPAPDPNRPPGER